MKYSGIIIFFLSLVALLVAAWGILIFVFKDGQDGEINRLKADVAETNELIETVNTTLSEEIETVNTTLCDKIMDVNNTLSSDISEILSIFESVNMSIYFDLNEAIQVVNMTLTQEFQDLNNEISVVNTTLCDKIMDGDTTLQTNLNNLESTITMEISTLNSTLTAQINGRLLSVDGVLGDMGTQNIDLMVNGTGFEVQPEPMTHTIKFKNTGVVTVNSVSSLVGTSDLIVSGIGMININSFPMTSTIEVDGTALSTAYSNLQMEVNMHQMDIVNLQNNITTINTEINNIQMMGNMLAQDLNGTTITLNMTIMELIMDVMTLQTTVISLQNQINAINSNTSGVPTGTISPFGGTVIPDGYLLCDGTQYSTTTYADLFNVIGTMYCPGPCTMGMFAVPDLRGKIPAGQGGTALSGTIGTTVGTETHTLTAAQMPFHQHGGSTDFGGAHQHDFNVYFNDNYPTVPAGFTCAPPYQPAVSTLGSCATTVITGNTVFQRWIVPSPFTADGAHSHTFTTGGAGSGQAHPNIQPSLIVKYIIKT
jgi:microcystin-dependent protein